MSGFARMRIEIEETSVTVAADERHITSAVDAILRAREEIQRHIMMDPFFLTTFEPYDCDSDCSETVLRMCDASRAAGVGPMATVAGAIAHAGLEAMVADGCTHGWVDNGGDIALLTDRPITVEIFSEPGAPVAYALRVDPVEEMMGICSSSGRLGHSISLGESDVAVAVANSAVLADAVATALGNRARCDASLDRCFDPLKHVIGFAGGLVMMDGDVGIWGDIPRIVEVQHNPRRITVHSKTSGSVDGAGYRCVSAREVNG